MVSYWLLKTEPGDYSFADLVREKQDIWDGVRAPLALKNMSLMKKGDQVFVYHTGKERSITGIAEVTRGPFPDPGEKNPRFLAVEIRAVEALRRPVSLKTIKAMGFPPEWELLRLPRLSVVPVSSQQWQDILSLATTNQKEGG